VNLIQWLLLGWAVTIVAIVVAWSVFFRRRK
jgi:hypothetical protein